MLLLATKKILLKICGIALLVFNVFSLISIITFNSSDPTVLHLNNNHVTNLGGRWGADIADIVLQSIGYAVFYPLAFLSILSFRLLNNCFPEYLLIRASVLLFTLPALCGALNLFVTCVGLNSLKFSGFIGDFIATESTQLIPKRVALTGLLGISLVGILASVGLEINEWKELLYVSIRATNYLIKFILRKGTKVFKKLSRLLRRKGKIAVSKEEHFEEIVRPVKKSNLLDKLKTTAKNEQKIEEKEFEDFYKGKKINTKFTLPPIDVLKAIPASHKSNISKENLAANGIELSQVLKDFGINADLLEVSPGPVVTLYEFEPAAGTKSARVIGLSDDIARSMKAISARISVIPGKNAIGIELPNQKRETVYLREMLESRPYRDSQSQLPLILGKNISGAPVIADLAKMPHLLVAGTTGSGKSVAINTMILSLLYRYTPETCKFVMIDPKMLELSVYEGIPHLLSPVVTDPKKAVVALKWVVKEMEERYRAMSTLGVRNIGGYNRAIIEAAESGQALTKNIQTGFDRSTGKPIFERIAMENKELPYIVVIVDEMADLMLVAGKDIESYIQRLAQMARAAGIHIIMATQRPSVDVITGVIKANFPTRISFQVTSKIDSRTILGEQGAEQLLGMGDMLYMMPGGRIERVHGPFVDDKEVENIVKFWKEQGEPEYIEEITADEEEQNVTMIEDSGDDDLYRQAVEIVMRNRKASTSYIQRCLRLGYNRAANIIERMEKEGLVSAPNHAGKREIVD
ncbi:MAG: DNA segregation ATPase FtsK/SpoIIIE or related protein [Candidatus Midichloria mitochondrii]|uniref:DNA translocase FtsK n=1 Tax=Midichloria mitochondrii (strain IricVA) TaxID=696127 RepID=F7XVW6_MIDMI|nr:DNA translocase FtsK 4TM domain-containing protein [Candidatus Midichloria mitochondrii]AEI88815.1 DNA translocase FtsK [Candidatus Midichloria mitochondrii IricVA]MDJ1256803.1 DNA translocase FtsK 4TM domain-containing protein [Candidatus Midichloria mitochondrii]MDJ1299385.1 DNA translocase FtsK 4TM domain-containing protein [Candidatus Midichloria mitochondrii]MDJ1312967.1 DNA translocase FtsK 4TM domain-containing protein [Candidatus Midichloria mitochondrii]MDJ1584071.1 DNA translocase